MSTRVGLAVLAAGLSRRFGPSDKLMASFQGRPLCDHVALTAQTFEADVKLAICARGGEAAEIFASRGFLVVENSQPQRGLSSSIRLAVNHAMDAGLDGLMICLADMPLIPPPHLENLHQAWLAGACPPAIASRAAGPTGWRSPPVMFGAAAFAELLSATGDQGARALIAEAPTVELDPRYLADFDTQEDFQRLSS